MNGLEPLGGGFSGETFLAPGPDGDVVVRIYARDPGRVVVDAALLRLTRGWLPVPRVLELRRPQGDHPGVLVTERLTGVPLDRAVEASTVDWPALGRSVGRVLLTLSGIPQVRAGSFHDADLVPDATGLPADLAAWAHGRRDSGLLAAWSEADWGGLLAVIDDAEDLHAEAEQRVVLVHSDLNLKNLLVDPLTWEVTGVLDWEFAHAGSPYADLGNLTRFEREPEFLAGIDAALGATALPWAERLRRARAADLWATVELAGRRNVTTVSRLADRLLRAQARSGDLGAWPWPTSRVAPHPGPSRLL